MTIDLCCDTDYDKGSEYLDAVYGQETISSYNGRDYAVADTRTHEHTACLRSYFQELAREKHESSTIYNCSKSSAGGSATVEKGDDGSSSTSGEGHVVIQHDDGSKDSVQVEVERSTDNSGNTNNSATVSWEREF